MLNIIVAPYSHNKTGEKHAKKIVKYLKAEQIEYSVYFSLNFDSLKENVKKLVDSGEHEYIVIGDDPIISSTISCFKDLSKIKLGIIPTSKNDDFAKYLKLSPHPIQGIKDILAKNIENIDLLIANDMTVLNSILIGASVEVFHMYNQFKVKNILTEQYANMRYGNSYPGVDLVFENKTKNKKELVFELIIANGGLSKGKPVSPLSNLKDGLFNLNYSTVSNKPGKKKFMRMLKKGSHIYNEDTKQHWLTNIKITSPDKKIKTLIDGKIYNFEELNVSIIEGGLKLYKKP